MTETLKLNLDEAWTFVSNMSRSRMFIWPRLRRARS